MWNVSQGRWVIHNVSGEVQLITPLLLFEDETLKQQFRPRKCKIQSAEYCGRVVYLKVFIGSPLSRLLTLPVKANDLLIPNPVPSGYKPTATPQFHFITMSDRYWVVRERTQWPNAGLGIAWSWCYGRFPPLSRVCSGVGARAPFARLVIEPILVRALAGVVALCSWLRHLTLTEPLSTQVYEKISTNLMLGSVGKGGGGGGVGGSF